MSGMPYSDAPLETALRDLGTAIDYPRTPDLGAVVRRELTTRAPRRLGWPGPRPLRLVLAIATALAIAVGVVLAVPPARDAVARFFHLSGVGIQRVPVVPTPPAPGSLEGLDLGEPIPLRDADRRAGFHVLVPASLPKPDRVFLYQDGLLREVTLVYAPGPGLPATRIPGAAVLLSEFRGGLRSEYLGKVVGPGTTVLDVTVGGSNGYWLEGAPHEVIYQEPGSDRLSVRPLRLAGNTLLWPAAALTLRLESGLDRDSAIAVGASAR